MNRGKWIRLFAFLAAFTLIALFPLHKFWLFELTDGQELVFRVFPSSVPVQGNVVTLRFKDCDVPAEKNSPFLRFGYVGFDVEDGFAKISRIASLRNELPPEMPCVKVRALFVHPTWDGEKWGEPYFYRVEPPFRRYFADDGKKAQAIQSELEEKKSAKLVVTLYPNGDYQISSLEFD